MKRRIIEERLAYIEDYLRQIRDALSGGNPHDHSRAMTSAYDQFLPSLYDGPTLTTQSTIEPRFGAIQYAPTIAHSNTITIPRLSAIAVLPPKRGDGIYHATGPDGVLPDPIGTPGAVNPAVTDDPAILKATIGTPGWTATVRPPTEYTDALKVQVMAEYGLAGRDPKDFELDHLIPLCCGGHPTSPLNLWPQRRAGTNGAAVKDLVEVAAMHAILAGRMALAAVQQGFARDWTALHGQLSADVVMVRLMMASSPPEPEP